MNTSLGLDEMTGLPALFLQALTTVTWSNRLHFHCFRHLSVYSLLTMVLVWNPGPLAR